LIYQPYFPKINDLSSHMFCISFEKSFLMFQIKQWKKKICYLLFFIFNPPMSLKDHNTSNLTSWWFIFEFRVHFPKETRKEFSEFSFLKDFLTRHIVIRKFVKKLVHSKIHRLKKKNQFLKDSDHSIALKRNKMWKIKKGEDLRK